MLSVTPAVFIPSYSNFIHYDCSHIEHVHPVFCAHLIVFLGVLNLDIITSTPPLECLHFFYLCVICNSFRFHSSIFKLCIIIVHTLKKCSAMQVQSRVWSCLRQYKMDIVYLNYLKLL